MSGELVCAGDYFSSFYCHGPSNFVQPSQSSLLSFGTEMPADFSMSTSNLLFCRTGTWTLAVRVPVTELCFLDFCRALSFGGEGPVLFLRVVSPKAVTAFLVLGVATGWLLCTNSFSLLGSGDFFYILVGV